MQGDWVTMCDKSWSVPDKSWSVPDKSWSVQGSQACDVCHCRREIKQARLPDGYVTHNTFTTDSPWRTGASDEDRLIITTLHEVVVTGEIVTSRELFYHRTTAGASTDTDMSGALASMQIG